MPRTTPLKISLQRTGSERFANRRRRSTIAGRLLVATLLAFAAFGSRLVAAAEWRQIGPFGAGLGCLAATSEGTVYFAGGSLARSDDGGASWREVNTAVAPPVLLADPDDARHLFAVVGDSEGRARVSESRDGGETFDALPAIASRPSIYELALDGGKTPALLAATDDGLYRADGGAWRNVSPPASGAAFAIAVGSRAGGDPPIWLLSAESATGTGGALYRSVDAGVTWAPIPGPFVSVLQIVFDPQRAGTVYAVDGTRILRSQDGGVTWRRLGRGFGAALTQALAIDAEGVLHAGTSRGLYRSMDGGVHWQADAGTVDVVSSVVAIPGRGLVAASYSGPLRAAAGEASWRPAVRGLRHLYIRSLAIDGDGTIIAAAHDVFVSRDGARTWSAKSTPLELPGGSPSLVLGASPADSTVYAANATYHGLNRSPDGGARWVPLAYVGSNPVTTVAVDPSSSRVVYFGGPETGDHYEQRRCHLMKSTDAAKTWTCLALGDGPVYDAIAIAIHPRLPRELVVATCCGFARSSDGGATWHAVGTLTEYVEATAVAFLGRDARALALASADTVYTSRDGGASVRIGGEGLPAGARIASLVADPTRPGDLYAGLVRDRGFGQGLGAYVSHDGGGTFRALGGGLPSTFTGSLVLDARRRWLYALTDGQSLLRIALD